MPTDKLSAAELDTILKELPEEVDLSTTASDTSFMRLLSTVNRDELDSVMVEEMFEPGDIIMREGEMGDCMYLIWSGRVAVVRGPFSSPSIVFQRRPGESVGEMALIEKKPRIASIVALDYCRMLRLNSEGFDLLVAQNPRFSKAVMKMISRRLRALQDSSSARIVSLKSENELLLESQRLRQEMSDLIIHDLRNPLGNIYTALNMLELVLPQEVFAQNRELMEIANISYERMQNLIESLLDVAKMETGDLPLELSQLNLPILFELVKTMFTFSFERREIDFRVVLPDELPVVHADEDRIRRVLTNLVDNAAKFSPKGGFIEVKVVVDEVENCLVVSVTDQGPGIPVEERERIFERFTQVQSEGGQKKSRRGYGLGLVFCRLAMRAHNGRIWVEDGPDGVGSCFVFTLPITSAES